ncbi:MAG: magnesium transporter [Planctomycetota bacterium]|jgi:magnesium transporter
MLDEQKQLLNRIEQAFETGNTAQMTTILSGQRASDIAEVVQVLDNDQRRVIFNVLDKPVSAEVLEKVDEATRGELFEILEHRELTSIITHLDADDAADVLQELSKEEIAQLLKKIPPKESAQIKDLMSYSEDSAGGIMDPLVISVTEDATVAQAVSKIRTAEIDEDFFSVFVVDKNQKFLGDVRIRLLLTRPETTTIKDLIESDTIYVVTDDDQERVRNVFRDNDLIVVPVLDNNHKLVGRITADRIIEVADEEATEDLYAMAGTDPDELESESIFRAARIRMTWLLPCLIGTSITALILMLFKSHYNPIFLAAAAFAPMIGAISGNAGLQTSAIVISGLAAGHLADLQLQQVFNREVRIAVVVALACGIIGGLLCAFLPQLLVGDQINNDVVTHSRVVFAFGIGMFSAIMVATTLGLFLPFLFRKIGIDPAISAGPLVTTANDSISVAIYMTLTLLLANPGG